MADTTALKNRIRAAIKANDNQEITGSILQQALLDMVDELDLNPELQEAINTEKDARQNSDTQLNNLITDIENNINNGYVYAGIATPSTVPVSGKVFYMAVQEGTYTNFGGTAVIHGINILKYNGSIWSKDVVIGIDDVPVVGSNNVVTSNAVCEYVGTIPDFSIQLNTSSIEAINFAPRDDTKVWMDTGGAVKAKIIPLVSNTKKLTVSSSGNAVCFLLKDGIPPTNQDVTPHFATGDNVSIGIEANTTVEIEIPDDCTHIGITVYRNNAYFTQSIICKGGDKPIQEQIDILNEKIEKKTIFDISEYNSENNIPSVYDNYEQALKDIPLSKRNGGMAVKFIIREEDNGTYIYKYVTACYLNIYSGSADDNSAFEKPSNWFITVEVIKELDSIFIKEHISVTWQDDNYHAGYWIDPSNPVYKVDSRFGCNIIDVKSFSHIKITGDVNMSGSIHVAFLASFPVSGQQADIIPYDDKNFTFIAAGESKYYSIPSNAAYMYLLTMVNNTSRVPSDVTGIVDRIYKLENEVNYLQSSTRILENERDIITIQPIGVTTGAFRINGTWDATALAYELKRYKVEGGDILYIKADASYYATYAFSETHSISNIISGTIEGGTVNAIVTVPNNATHLLINTKKEGTEPIVQKLSSTYAKTFTHITSLPKPIKFAEKPWYNTMALGCSGRYVFAQKDNGICKIDAGIESQLEAGSVIAVHGNGDFRPCGCAINGNYLYLVTRNTGSGQLHVGSSPYGGFLDIINITSWEVINTISYSTQVISNCYFGKATGVATYGNYLAVAMNLGGFKLYDITDRENPIELGGIDNRQNFADNPVSPAIEYQECSFYTDNNNNLRLLMVGYGKNFIEIYNPSESITSREDALCVVYNSDISAIRPPGHTKGAVVKYPYVYYTLGPWPGNTHPYGYQVGIIVTDISDLTSLKTKIFLVPDEDRGQSFAIEGTPYSVALTDNGNLIINCYNSGYAIFSIKENPAEPVYKGVFGTPYASNIIYTDDGRLICSGAKRGSNEAQKDTPITIWRGI